jgi:hypothetical protein
MMQRGENLLPAIRISRLALAILAALVVSVILFSSTSAQAEPRACMRIVNKDREIDGEHFAVVVFGGCTGTDLFYAARVFPQKDLETGKALPPQVQLRSIYTVNDKEVSIGGKNYRTVLRGCIPNSKPWPDQTADEKDFCKGKVNYFPNGFGGEVLIPHTRKPSILEKTTEALSIACKQLKTKSEITKIDQKALESCTKLLPGFAVGTAKVVPTPDDPKAASEDQSVAKVAALVTENRSLNQRVAMLVPQANRASWLWPLFFVIVGLSIYGAGSTLGLISGSRKHRELVRQYNAYKRGDKNGRVSMIGDAKQTVQQEMLEKLEIEKKNLKVQLEAKYSGISANLAARIKELEAALISAKKIAEENAAKVAQARIDRLEVEAAKKEERNVDLTEELAGAQQQITELRGEISALSARNIELEKEATESHTKARDANREKVVLEERVALLETSVHEKDQEVEGMRQQVAKLEDAVQGFQQRHAGLLQAQSMCGMHTGTGMCQDKDRLKRTLPLGLTADELARVAEDAGVSDNADASKQNDANLEPDVDAKPTSHRQGSGYSMVYLEDSPEEEHFVPDGMRSATGATEGNMPEAWNREPHELTPLCDPEELHKRASDSTRPQPGEEPEEDAMFPLHLDEGDPRGEMPTLTESDGISQRKILEEQVIHYQTALATLADFFARKLVPGMRVTVSSNTEETYLALKDGLEAQLADYSRLTLRLEAAEEDVSAERVARDMNAKAIKRLENDLRAKEEECVSAFEAARVLREEADAMRRVIYEEKPREKLYAYQLAAAQAEQRALVAEKARQKIAEESADVIAALQQAKAELESRFATTSKIEGIPVWQEEHNTDSGIAPDPNKADEVSEALGLSEKDRLPAREVLAQLSQEELLRLASSVFFAIAEHIGSGDKLELPIGEMADIFALHDVANIPLVSVYGFVMPQTMRNIAGQGQPRLYHTMHDTFGRPKDVQEEPHSTMTMPPPPTGVPADRNSTPPSTDTSVVRSRAAICPIPSEKDDESRSAS